MVKLFNEQKHSDQKMRLLSQARRLFAACGVKETSMSQIAEACKVTKATLYHYFKSKETILKEILQCRTEEITLVATARAGASDAEQVFYQIAKNHLEHIQKPENLELMKILLSETMKNQEMREYYMDFVFENISKSTALLEPLLKIRKSEKELRLLFFQFMATLMHYDWNTRMVGDLTPLLGDEETFIRQLAKTYAVALRTP